MLEAPGISLQSIQPIVKIGLIKVAGNKIKGLHGLMDGRYLISNP
jgi:hypothetical protein